MILNPGARASRVARSAMRSMVSIGAIAWAGSPAYAQEAPAGPPPPAEQHAAASSPAEGPNAVDEILVTAQKKSRAERLQDVPIAITALGPVQIERVKLKTLVDIGSMAPGVSLGNNGPMRGVASFNIRGLGSSSNVPSVEPAVGTFIDGVYLGTNYGVVLDTFDIEGIEILRGPQGTLQGRNVTGGAVLVRTARPGDDLHTEVQASLESGPEYKFAGSVGGPLNDVVKAKVAAYYKKDEGWFHNQFTKWPVGRERVWFVRPTVVFEPTDRFTTTLILEKGRTRGDGSVAQNDLDPSLHGFDLNYNEVGYTRIDWNSVTSESTFRTDFGNGVVTNLFNYRDVLQNALLDTDGSTATFFHLYTYFDEHQYSDELRYAGTFGRVDLTVGAHYFQQGYRYLERRLLAGGAIDRTFGGRIHQDSLGLFGQSDIHLSPNLTATLGIRYSTEKKEAHIDRSPAGAGASNCDFVTRTCPFSFLPKFADSKRWNAWTPKVSLNWKPLEELMVYGTWSKGVRSGGYNVRSSSSTVLPGPYEPERQNAFEVGFKSEPFSRRVRLNGAAYFNRINGLQRDIIVVAPPPEVGNVQVIRNAANADIYGGEGEFVFVPNRDLELNLNAGYTKAKYKTVLFDLTGDGVIDGRDFSLEPPRLSRWTLGAGGTWSRWIAEDLKGQINLNYSYRSRAPIDDANSIFVGARNMLVGNITLSWPKRGLELSVYGRNLLNESRESSRVNISLGVPPYRFRALEEGRSLGIEARWRR
jgi:iron complex outermembrane receptor protein